MFMSSLEQQRSSEIHGKQSAPGEVPRDSYVAVEVGGDWCRALATAKLY
jgi:hypothetical protein